jgi:hypothetical protein
VYGVFELLSGRPRAFEERDFVALNRLAEMIQTAVEHADAARRAEAELGRPEVAAIVATETLPAASSHGEIVEADSEKPAPEIEKAPTATAGVEHHLAELNLGGIHLAESHLVEPNLAKANLAEFRDVVVAPAATPALVGTPELAAIAPENQAEDESASPITTIAFGNLRRCETCGFPVSEGRRLCLDCEAATPDAIASINGPELFGELAESNTSWARSHMYLIATAVVAVATIVLLAWRL